MSSSLGMSYAAQISSAFASQVLAEHAHSKLIKMDDGQHLESHEHMNHPHHLLPLRAMAHLQRQLVDSVHIGIKQLLLAEDTDTYLLTARAGCPLLPPTQLSLVRLRSLAAAKIHCVHLGERYPLAI
jgi:hypothetical protein